MKDRGCLGLADAIELETADAEKIAHDDLGSLVGQYRKSGNAAPLKAVILGCTHYPFLMLTLERIRQKLGMDFIFINPAVDVFVSVPSKSLPSECVAADGMLTSKYKYGRSRDRDEVTTKFVPLKSGTVDKKSLAHLVRHLPLTRAQLIKSGEILGESGTGDSVQVGTNVSCW